MIATALSIGFLHDSETISIAASVGGTYSIRYENTNENVADGVGAFMIPSISAEGVLMRCLSGKFLIMTTNKEVPFMLSETEQKQLSEFMILSMRLSAASKK